VVNEEKMKEEINKRVEKEKVVFKANIY